MKLLWRVTRLIFYNLNKIQQANMKKNKAIDLTKYKIGIFFNIIHFFVFFYNIGFQDVS